MKKKIKNQVYDLEGLKGSFPSGGQESIVNSVVDLVESVIEKEAPIVGVVKSLLPKIQDYSRGHRGQNR